MSLLAPIILDNGTGYSKLGCVERQKQAIFSLILPHAASQAIRIHPCKHDLGNACSLDSAPRRCAAYSPPQLQPTNEHRQAVVDQVHREFLRNQKTCGPSVASRTSTFTLAPMQSRH